MTAMLAAVTLALGVVVGAAIGPAPSPSFAVDRLLPLLPSLLGAGRTSASPAQPPAAAPQPTPSVEASSGIGRRRRRRLRGAGAAAVASATEASATEAQAPAETSSPSATSPSSAGKPKAATIAPVTKVWLVALAGSSFEEAAANAAAAPYLDHQAIPSGTLLSSWSAIDGNALASAAAALAEPAPQLLNTIVQPPCPEGAAGEHCAADTPGALTAADEFLQATLPTITSTAAYRENGLIVVTFASVANATATGLPAGATAATLTSQPPAGVLLVSPFATGGAKSSTPFNPTSPKQSLEKLLRR
jgi:hypothetical protein